LKVKLLKKLKADDYLARNAQLAYVYADLQSDFVEKLAKISKSKSTNENNKSNIENKIIILKRLDEKYVQFDWLLDLTNKNSDLEFVDEIKSNLKYYINNEDRLQYKMIIPHFYEESSQVNIHFTVLNQKKINNYFQFF
jgi:hypothetical protein